MKLVNVSTGPVDPSVVVLASVVVGDVVVVDDDVLAPLLLEVPPASSTGLLAHATRATPTRSEIGRMRRSNALRARGGGRWGHRAVQTMLPVRFRRSNGGPAGLTRP